MVKRKSVEQTKNKPPNTTQNTRDKIQHKLWINAGVPSESVRVAVNADDIQKRSTNRV